MQKIISVFAIAVAALVGPTLAVAADAAASAAGKGSSCEAQAAEKKLAGAAKNSFVTKCQKDAMASATATCESQAADKKLAGAAKNSFVKKCVSDATK